MQVSSHLDRFLVAFAAALILILLGSGAATAQDDQALFTTAVPPNVVLMIDNSGSMHHIVWHPSYDPAATPTCGYFLNPDQYNVNLTDADVFPDGGAGDHFFRAGIYAITGTGCTTSPREIFVDPAVEATGNRTRYTGRYLNWLYSTATTANLAEIVATNNGTHSGCIGGGTYDLYRRSRITAAKDILREVICQVNAAGKVRFGMAQFRRGETDSFDPQGGYVVVPAEDYLDASGNPNPYTLNGVSKPHGDHLNDAISNLTGESWTPLAETLFHVYMYFMSRDSTKRPPGQVTGTFPEYEFLPSHPLNGDLSTAGAPTVPDSPVQFECQKNFVIVITDGEPTRDDFSTDLNNTDVGFAAFNNLIGDYIPLDEVETGLPSNGSLLLDDIAKFMHEKDFRPDLAAHAGAEQTLDVYTVGFTTSPAADDILSRAATQGGGQFYRSNDPQSLARDLVLAITDILLKSQAFTSATVPAGRASSDEKLYTSDFIPSTADGYWQGHLRSWAINSLAQILDMNGACALDDPECRSGAFLSSAIPFWDAAEVMKTNGVASRNLLVSRPDGAGTNMEVTAFSSGSVTATDMGLTNADIPTYNFGVNPLPVDQDALTVLVVDNVRGCELGTAGLGCVQRPWLLGDIFHSNPLVIKKPNNFDTSLSYKGFVSNYADRKKVIVGGTNSGFLEIFDAGDWDTSLNNGKGAYTDGTGTEIAGFMPYGARQNAKELPRDDRTRDYYFVDGASAAADAFLPSDPRTANLQNAASWTDWKTVLVGGLRQGGRHYYALDVTDPAGGVSCSTPGSPNYPCYMWEFPNEIDTGTHVPFMGESWSEPVIAKVKVNDGTALNDYGRYVMIVGAGYDTTSDPNRHASYDPTATAGRAIMMIDVATGKLLAIKKFDNAGVVATTDPNTVTYDPADPEKSMFFAVASQPGVYDVDFDGYVDEILIGDLGGNVWKWVVNDTGEDPILNTLHGRDQPNWHFSRFFAAPSYLDAVSGNRFWKSIFFRPGLTRVSGTYWMSFTTGQRANLQFTGFQPSTVDDERIYVIKDYDLFMDVTPLPLTLTESDLDGGTPGAADYTLTLGTAAPPSGQGFYVRGVGNGEKFVTQTIIFLGYVITASFTPASVIACGASGDATLYTFKVINGEGLTVTNSVTGVDTTIVKSDMGDGMPSNPQVTMDNSSGDTTVIVRLQDGAIWQPPGDFSGGSDGYGQLYWREL